MTTLTRAVAASADDAVELSGVMTLNGVNLNANSAGQNIGLRFANVTIPAGATITAAYLTLNVVSTSYDDPNLTIRGSGEATTTTFTSTTNDITTRFKTAATVTWNAGSIGAGARNSPDLSAILAEILAIPGWASGNAINFYLFPNAGSALRVYAYDNGSNAPQLTIDYTEPAAAGQPARSQHQFRLRRGL
ncbi:MAG TPA: hypothetical protein PK829_03545 [Promineifilum sp.]|nr:hypothetical protein [Promineifilum sp.]